MKIPSITSTKEVLLSLSKEELTERLLKAEQEKVIQFDLLKETLEEYKKLKQTCVELEKQLSQSVGDGYKESYSWVSKIVFVLKSENRPLRSADLISILERKETFLRNHANKARFFSVFINTAVKYKRVVREKVNGVRGYYYLLPEWIEDNGKVLSAYKTMMV